MVLISQLTFTLQALLSLILLSLVNSQKYGSQTGQGHGSQIGQGYGTQVGPGYGTQGQGGGHGGQIGGGGYGTQTGGGGYGTQIGGGGYGTQTGGGGYGTGTGSQVTPDGCFRVYKNCIIVNAQPFDRRSATRLTECQNLCLGKQTGQFSCRSFVYDTMHQICDLFAHTGNQYPARLVQYYGRDYYEPTGQCSSVGPVTTAGPLPANVQCAANETPVFLEIDGFILVGNDDVIIEGVSLEQCITACSENKGPDGSQVPCRSFDYDKSKRECAVSAKEVAIPEGDGQLQAAPNGAYYQKSCLDSTIAAKCDKILPRIPQMVLVGFAETVITARDFDECLKNCLDSQALFGFGCTSGMFYFGETSMNCILNSENRVTQPDLFTEENVDQVDYFELNCNRALSRRFGATNVFGGVQRLISNRGLASSRRRSSARESVHRFVSEELAPSTSHEGSNEVAVFGEWTQWSKCDRSIDGRRIRYLVCSKPNLADCNFETEWCNRSEEKKSSQLLTESEKPFFLLDAAKSKPNAEQSARASCQLGMCCPYRSSCQLGIIQLPDGKRQWCTNPCESG